MQLIGGQNALYLLWIYNQDKNILVGSYLARHIKLQGQGIFYRWIELLSTDPAQQSKATCLNGCGYRHYRNSQPPIVSEGAGYLYIYIISRGSLTAFSYDSYIHLNADNA